MFTKTSSEAATSKIVQKNIMDFEHPTKGLIPRKK